MANSADVARDAGDSSAGISRITRQISPRLAVSAAGIVALGIATGFLTYLHRSPAREAYVSGTSAWDQQLVLAGAACVLYAVIRWRNGRRLGRRSGRLLLLSPLGRCAQSRLMAT